MPKSPYILTRQQVRHVDELAITDLKLPSIVLMENAGKNAADWIRDRYADLKGTVRVFCGSGNNGGDGFVIARHLHNAGFVTQINVVGNLERLTPDASTNHAVALAMKLPISITGDEESIRRVCAELTQDDLVVDALLGTGFEGSVREPMTTAIDSINTANLRGVVAVDVPSGLDCDTGQFGNVAIRAIATITFVAIKKGFEVAHAQPYVGEIVVVDIGIPPALIQHVLAKDAEA